jgi:hypothetical protein
MGDASRQRWLRGAVWVSALASTTVLLIAWRAGGARPASLLVRVATCALAWWLVLYIHRRHLGAQET